MTTNNGIGLWRWVVSLVLRLLSFLRLYPPPPQYFLPGQMVYYVRHANDLNEQQIQGLMGWSNELVPGAGISSRRVITFPAIIPPQSSDENSPDGPLEARGPSSGQPAIDPLGRLSLIFANILQADDLVKVINLLHERRESQPVAGMSLQLVGPHWLMSSSNHVPATGGPGGWPVQAEHSHDEGRDPRQGPKLQIWQGSSVMHFGPTAGKKVHVAILDTVHPQHVLDQAYHERHWHHPLIDEMLNPAKPMIDFCRATFDDLHDSVDFSLQRHGYLERDHGLFILDLIHRLAPQAQLHLYEALNPYGIGTIESVAHFLTMVLDDRSLRPVVINCSFTLGVPGTFDPRAPADLQDPGLSIEQLFAQSNTKGVVVVAAAGNDTRWPTGRQDTRYPAAFKNIFGVGALKKASPTATARVASYSNVADKFHPDEGYMTLGGEPGIGNGIIGMYIDDFPKLSLLGSILNWLGWSTARRVRYVRNTTGWGEWSGSSFSAAIVSGVLAALHGQPGFGNTLNSFQEAQRSLNRLAQPASVEGAKEIRAEQV